MEWISDLFAQYGYLVLFLGLFAESVALPFPGELAMMISGHMVHVNTFNMAGVMGVSFAGAFAGTIFTYVLGRKLGTPFFDKYGKYVLLNPERLLKIKKWFDKYGDKIILVSYFVPGLRHFTGYVSGILKIRLKTFLIFNGLSGVLWVITYVMVGFLFGTKIQQLLHVISQYSTVAIIAAAIALTGLVVVKRNKETVLGWLRARYAGIQKMFMGSAE
ncbi:DedA family protein [Paenibacillus sp. 1P03SA]|uniref:DedA family protein n=1 Tax=Paenibacillus sp. 1P03SA TaxID=3132294 RepID=UPI0039A168D5